MSDKGRMPNSEKGSGWGGKYTRHPSDVWLEIAPEQACCKGTLILLVTPAIPLYTVLMAVILYQLEVAALSDSKKKHSRCDYQSNTKTKGRGREGRGKKKKGNTHMLIR